MIRVYLSSTKHFGIFSFSFFTILLKISLWTGCFGTLNSPHEMIGDNLPIFQKKIFECKKLEFSSVKSINKNNYGGTVSEKAKFI